MSNLIKVKIRLAEDGRTLLMKAGGKLDTSKLVQVEITNKKGQRQKVWKSPAEAKQIMKNQKRKKAAGDQAEAKIQGEEHKERKKSKREIVKNAIKGFIESMTDAMAGKGGVEEAIHQTGAAGQRISKHGELESKQKKAQAKRAEARVKTAEGSPPPKESKKKANKTEYLKRSDDQGQLFD